MTPRYAEFPQGTVHPPNFLKILNIFRNTRLLLAAVRNRVPFSRWSYMKIRESGFFFLLLGILGGGIQKSWEMKINKMKTKMRTTIKLKKRRAGPKPGCATRFWTCTTFLILFLFSHFCFHFIYFSISQDFEFLPLESPAAEKKNPHSLIFI